VPDIQAQANAAPGRLAKQGVQQHSSDPPTANVRVHPDRDLGRTLIDEECRLLIGCELPRPRSTYWPAVSFGNESEILGPLPSREMSSDERNRLRRVGVRLIRRDRREIPRLVKSSWVADGAGSPSQAATSMTSIDTIWSGSPE
jgi:hypothetical protein